MDNGAEIFVLKTARDRITREYHHTCLHALHAAGILQDLQQKLQAAPWLKHIHKFRCELEIAALRVNRAACKEAYWRSLLLFGLMHEEKYDPNQPRVPAGNPDSGQWTYVPGYARGRALQEFDDYLRGKPSLPNIDDIRRRREGEVVEANLRPRSGGGGRIGAQFQNSTPAQQARLAAAETEAREGLRLVRQIDPNYRLAEDSLTMPGSIEGAIANQQAITRQARTRLIEIETYRNLLSGSSFDRSNLQNKW